MNKNAIKWLQEELPELVAQGIVPGEVAERIQSHYCWLTIGTPLAARLELFYPFSP
jgi:hypothetical protein